MADNTIALQARAPRMLSYGELVNMRDQANARRNALAMQQQTMQQNAMTQQKARATEAAMAQALPLANAGDYAGAEARFGLGVGNPDVHAALSKLQDEHRAEVHAKLSSLAPVAIEALKIADPTQRAALFQAAAPQLMQYGWTKEQIAGFPTGDADLKGAIANAQTADDAMKAYAKQNEAYTLTPGSTRFVGNQQIANVPQLEKVTYLKQPDGSFIPVPVNMSPTGRAPSGGALSVDALRGAIVAQESKGNYGAVSPKGALGAYQLMPPTAKSLAGRLGLPWQPELMTANTPEAKQYQDALGGAAIQEAVNASGGDLATAAKYYHGGSNRAVWGPKTEQYARDVAGRMGGGGDNAVQIGKPIGATKPAADKSALPPQQMKAMSNELQQAYDLINNPANSAAFQSAKNSWLQNQTQSLTHGTFDPNTAEFGVHTILPGGVEHKSAWDRLTKHLIAAMYQTIKPGQAGMNRAVASQKMHVQMMGGGDNPSRETLLEAIRSTAADYGITLRDTSSAGGQRQPAHEAVDNNNPLLRGH